MATLSLPAFIMIVLIVFGLLLEKFLRDEYQRKKILVVFVIISLALSTFHIYRVHSEGINQSRLVHGTNYLIRRAHLVNMVIGKLQSDKKQISSGSLLIFENIELAALGYEKGPKVWLEDNTIEVFDLNKNRQELRENIIKIEDSSKIIFYKRINTQLKHMSLNELNVM